MQMKDSIRFCNFNNDYLFQDRFEAVNQAYEFLCSRNVWTGDGPNTNNIVLILRTQTILFQRYSEGKT